MRWSPVSVVARTRHAVVHLLEHHDIRLVVAQHFNHDSFGVAGAFVAAKEAAVTLIRNMGKLGIPVWCYEWMPVMNWMRTSTTVPSRGGALATGYDHSLMVDAPLTEYDRALELQLAGVEANVEGRLDADVILAGMNAPEVDEVIAANHALAGIRHLIWDTGRALDLRSAYTGGWLVLIGTVVLTAVVLGVLS